MLIKVYDKEVLRRKNQFATPAPVVHQVGLFRCDQCGTEYEVDGRLNYVLSKKNHFCSRKCQGLARREGGCLHYVYDTFECSFSNPETHAKSKKTMLERYGVENTLSNPDLHAKQKATMKSRYGGVGYGSAVLRKKLDFKAMAKKRHETMKATGAYKTSKEEDAFFEYLMTRFDRVERNVVVNQVWPIDFYLPDIDTYVQFDGAYWHGLDRPIEVIAEHRTARDVMIHRKWKTDREQEIWFRERGMRLVRVPSTAFDRRTMTCMPICSLLAS